MNFVLIVCQKYESSRDQLFNIITNKVLYLQLLNMEQKFVYLLNSEDNIILNSVG